MITNNCSLAGLLCKSIVIKSGLKLNYGIGLWNQKKLGTKDHSQCTVTIGLNALEVYFNISGMVLVAILMSLPVLRQSNILPLISMKYECVL